MQIKVATKAIKAIASKQRWQRRRLPSIGASAKAAEASKAEKIAKVAQAAAAAATAAEAEAEAEAGEIAVVGALARVQEAAEAGNGAVAELATGQAIAGGALVLAQDTVTGRETIGNVELDRAQGTAETSAGRAAETAIRKIGSSLTSKKRSTQRQRLQARVLVGKSWIRESLRRAGRMWYCLLGLSMVAAAVAAGCYNMPF